jgi:UDP-N-acetylglucosamine acyltransferase
MVSKIHNTAIIHPNAQIADDVEIGPFTIVEDDVQISSGTKISSNALIASGTRIGNNCNIYNGVVLGTVPQDLKFGGEKTTLEIGNNTTIREFATLNRGTTDHWKTVVGDNCLLMAYSHVAHDCTIGNNVILSNSVNMAGHVTIEDYVIVSPSLIHQFVKIGKHTFIGGASKVRIDVPPYILAVDDPLRYGGLNSVGLKRRGFDDSTLASIKKAYKIIYRSKLLLADALKKVENELDPIDEVKDIVSFFRNSERGVIR